MARGTTSTASNNPISPPLPALPPPTPISKQSQVFAGGPVYPSSWQPTASGDDRGRTAQHSRRPSRAERYEVLVESARELIRRADHGGHVGLGIDSEQRGAVDQEEWRDTVGNLLKVVDGMARQLATHDELAAQLKIAQSNLTLAETHSEFLEETLRRRDSRSSVSMVSRHSASGAPAPPNVPSRRATTEGDRPESSASLFGLGLEDSRSSAASFFRMPSKRKQTPSVVSTASSVSLPPPTAPHTLRSSSSSPRLGDHPRNSHDTASSEDRPSLLLENGAGKTVSQLTSELFALQAQVTSLEQSCTTLKSTNTSLRRSAEVMAGRCAELEKTKDDLMAELENLSMELFQEANTMVADERKKSAKSEEEVTRLRTEIESLSRDLELLRRGMSGPHDDDRRHSGASSKTMLPRRPPNSTLPTLSPPDPSASNSPSLAPITTSASPNISQSGSPDPDSVSLASATSSRKWFNFGRSASVKSRSGSERDDSGVSPNPNGGTDSDGGMLQPPQAPGMLRAGSTSSLRSISSVSSSFFSAMSADDKVERDKEMMRDGDAEMGEREELLDERDRDAEEEEDLEQDPTTPMVSSNARGRIPSLPKASLYPLPPSPTPNHPPPPALSVQMTSPPPPARPSPPPINTSSLSPRIQPPASATSGFSTDSSPSSSPSIPFPSSTSPNPSSRSPRLDLTRGARPVAIHSFEGEAIAKSPKSPNAARWAELAGAIPSPSTSTFAASTSSPPLAGAQATSEERTRTLSAAGRSSTESSRSRSPLLPSNEREKERHEPARVAHRPPPLKLDTSATAPLATRPSPPPPARPAPPPSSTTAPAPTASAIPPSLSRSSSERTNPSPSPTTTTFPSANDPSSPQPLPSPTFSLPPSASGLISTSTSLSSLRSPEGLMRNIEDMNRSLFGDDDEEDEEEGVKDEVKEQEAKRRE
ncbi:hypothetical protein BCR35DRAFT_310693 [Leucosporidium creatinivorum]|uniref:GDP/GTP exchange factor Sec2 N-terminal domain-containing protein n=1 Tax=Leucosporidium creatinivorum TaxID=106004 RepID=A0A1Y2CZK1_9BASI|nr:hypothetical protein BCR35DRAFT_310693 [Leucosporidium creatinivorum]